MGLRLLQLSLARFPHTSFPHSYRAVDFQPFDSVDVLHPDGPADITDSYLPSDLKTDWIVYLARSAAFDLLNSARPAD